MHTHLLSNFTSNTVIMLRIAPSHKICIAICACAYLLICVSVYVCVSLFVSLFVSLCACVCVCVTVCTNLRITGVNI